MGLGDDTRVEQNSLVALQLWAPIPLSRRPDLPVKQAYRWKDSHRLLEALKEKCLRNIIKPTSKPFREGHKSPVTHITGYELIILLIFKGHIFLSCRSLTFATGKRGGGDILEPALTEVCHAMPCHLQFQSRTCAKLKKHRSGKLEIFASFL